MKKLTLIAIVLLLGLTACGGGKVDVPAPASNPNGTVLYATDFSKNDKGWDEGSHDDDRVRIQDGELTFDVQTLNWDLWSNPNDLKINNFVVVDVDARRVSGTDTGTYGLLCGYQDVDNYYGMIIGDDGYAEIYRWVGGVYETLSSQQGVAVNQAANNHLTARCESDRLAFEINGTPVLEAPVSDMKTGNVGVVAGAFDPANVQFAFDNFIVSSLP